MTAARIADLVVEAVSAPAARTRTADVNVEMVVLPTTRARVADLYVEMVVAVGPSGWAQGISPW